MKRTTIITVAAVLIAVSGCAPKAHDSARRAALAPIASPTVDAAAPKDYPGIHNAVAYAPGFISGSVPEGEEGFETLAAMGVRTIISVDGAEPELAKANALGMRYIHLPIGYSGFGEERRLELTRAVRDSMKEGPVYIHCHHGKHRSAGAAAAVAAGLGWLTPDQGVARMKVSGTAANYTGLYACAVSATTLTPGQIDAVPSEFPAISRPTSFVQGMVDMDHAFEHLKAIEKAGWVTPADHPDLVPAAEAGRLADLYRVLGEGGYASRQPDQFVEWMRTGNRTAQELEDLLAAGSRDTKALSAKLADLNTSCKQCHAKYRDQPLSRR